MFPGAVSQWPAPPAQQPEAEPLAVGQGALAIEIRRDDREVLELIRPLDDSKTHIEVTAERAFLAALGGGCRAPIAALAEEQEGEIFLTGLVASPDGSQLFRDRITGEAAKGGLLGKNLAARILAGGAAGLIESLRDERPA